MSEVSIIVLWVRTVAFEAECKARYDARADHDIEGKLFDILGMSDAAAEQVILLEMDHDAELRNYLRRKT